MRPLSHAPFGSKSCRYLAYDLVVLKGHPLRDMPWLQRYLDLRKEVISPRDKEKRYIQRQLPEKFISPPLPYKYEMEACSVRLKEFWPLFRARKLIDKMIPSLCHEADGLILQSCNSGYVANTDNALLKFKFAHLNSVDFYLEVEATAGPSGGQGYHIFVLDASRGRRGPGPQRGQDWNKKEIQQPVTFPKGVDGRAFHNHIIECTWVEASQSWQFLRVREDKDKPNADYVCNKVIASIKDNIRESELVDYLESVFYHVPHYHEDLTTMPPEAKPAALPPPPTFQAPSQAGARGPAAAADGAGGDATAANGVVDPDVMCYQPLVYLPASPPYYGPEPTPPHPSDQPVLPDMWIPHDATKYPQEYLSWPEDPCAQPAEDPAYLDQQPGHEAGPYNGQPELQQQQQQWEERPPEGHWWNADSGHREWQQRETSVDPFYVEEDEWNQWGKKQDPVPSGGLTSQAADGEQDAGEGAPVDGGLQGNSSAGSDVGPGGRAEKAVVGTTWTQGAQGGNAPGKGVKRKEAGVGEQKPKRGKKMGNDDFFDDLNAD
ncbi:mRNA capping enzyme, catalytic domain-containing protein [Dunaliella salina]|uniref:mRNA guanylyltransferase n=1 Tax=Dunaliella salina TaxID=3046 RepID=A0ABQ7H2J8_DUNSA|nr:mRNA capping enzyme, catalytic domain-containing protein [Dunaliella salina]|eukprot:KAF5841084.1 mRNA capping enzyme, catalytic domain-containing protein [Dunaliella salina]